MNSIVKYIVSLGLCLIFFQYGMSQEPKYPATTKKLDYSGKQMVYHGENVRVFDDNLEVDVFSFEISDNLPDGRYVALYKNDTARIAFETFIVDKKQNGVAKCYAFEGTIQSIETYKNGILDGKVISYRPNGSIGYSATYKGGKLNGLTEKYHPNGVKKLEVMYKDGKAQKVQKEWNDKGELIRETYYKNGVYMSSKDIKGEK